MKNEIMRNFTISFIEISNMTQNNMTRQTFLPKDTSILSAPSELTCPLLASVRRDSNFSPNMTPNILIILFQLLKKLRILSTQLNPHAYEMYLVWRENVCHLLFQCPGMEIQRPFGTTGKDAHPINLPAA
jgi:hypothetical protein